MIHFSLLEEAQNRIRDYVNRTPLFQSNLLNHWLGHRVIFKAENLQKIGAFKARGGCNAVAHLIENNQRPGLIVANSSGNHAQAVAWAASLFGLSSCVFMPKGVSEVKAKATCAYGAEVIYGEDRFQVDTMVEEAAREKDTCWIPPFNHVDVIAGQGTAALEALHEIGDVDAVFAPCGGGGLLSGTLVACRKLAPDAEVIGAEPREANDAVQSRLKGSIQKLKTIPDTIADGARTLSLGPLTFEHIRLLDDLIEVPEDKIIYWTQWLNHLLKLRIEPTSAMCMHAVCQYLAPKKTSKTVLVILSGGNIDQKTMNKIWERDYLSVTPHVK